MKEVDPIAQSVKFYKAHQDILTDPLDDKNLPPNLEYDRRKRIRDKGHIFLEEAREALEPSYLSDFCKEQVIFELQEELMNRKEGEVDMDEIAIDQVFVNPYIALDIEMVFFDSVTQVVDFRRRKGIGNPVNLADWKADINKRLELKKR